MRILIEPKNALTKQYRKLFEMENVGLTFDPEALRAVAQKALKRGTGARGLRAILEHTMTDIMFDLPSRDDVREIVITRESVLEDQAAAGGDGAGRDEAGGVARQMGRWAEARVVSSRLLARFHVHCPICPCDPSPRCRPSHRIPRQLPRSRKSGSSRRFLK